MRLSLSVTLDHCQDFVKKSRSIAVLDGSGRDSRDRIRREVHD
jgi:hypothetical protein